MPPTQFAKRDSISNLHKCVSHVRDHIVRKCVKWIPRKVVALVRLGVDDFTTPLRDDKKEVDALIIRFAVHDLGKDDVLWV